MYEYGDISQLISRKTDPRMMFDGKQSNNTDASHTIQNSIGM